MGHSKIDSAGRAALAAGLFLVTMIGGGCRLSRVDTSTGLPYWPPQEARGEAAPERAFPRSAEAWRNAALEWEGTPYQVGGTDRTGIDCSAFTGVLYRTVAGRRLARTASGQWREGVAIGQEDLQPGDLVFFTTTQDPISHVGVSLGGAQFTHASTSRGVTFSSLTEPYWRDRFAGARRIEP